jgi:hypothetical protein
MEHVFGLVSGPLRKEQKEMVSTQLTSGDYDARIQQLAGEIVIRAIDDIRMLQRRGILNGIQPTGARSKNVRDCNCYRRVESVRKLVDDFSNGVILFWCKVAGIDIDQATLNRVIKKNHGTN